MKIQLNGFDIEINTSDTEMMVKVIDANGQELSNNTYSQSLDTSDGVEDVEIPGLDEEDGLDEEGLDDEDLDLDLNEDSEDGEDGLDDEDLDLDEESDEDEDDEDEDEDDITFDENKVYDFTEFKKLSESKKRKLNRKTKSTK